MPISLSQRLIAETTESDLHENRSSADFTLSIREYGRCPRLDAVFLQLRQQHLPF